MSGPRLQSNLVEGCEGAGGTVIRYHYGGMFGLGGESGSYRRADVTEPVANTTDVIVGDCQDGLQTLSPISLSRGGTDIAFRGVGVRYALKTTTPNMYVVVNFQDSKDGEIIRANFHRHQLGDGPFDYSQAQTLTVELPSSEWRTILGGTPQAVSRTTTDMYDSTITQMLENNRWAMYSGAYINVYSGTSGAAIALSVSSDKITVTFEFPANSFQIYTGSKYYQLWPMDMTTRKMGGPLDVIKPRTNSYDFLAKVWSPIKNSYCLKNLADGEIPILNE